MRFIVKGKYTGNESALPSRDTTGSTQFKEPENMTELSRVVTTISLVLMFIMFLIFGFVCGINDINPFAHYIQILFAGLFSVLVFLPHEFLHAICFKGDVEFYENLKQGMLFVVGTEDMSRARFIFMSLLPTIVFGFIPFTIFLFKPASVFCGLFGGVNIAAGAGDFFNIYNAIRLVPKGAMIFMSGLHSYWYDPKDKKAGSVILDDQQDSI